MREAIYAGKPEDAATWLVGGIFILFVIRVAVLSFSPLSLHWEEALYWVWSRELALDYGGDSPLVAWSVMASTSVFGDAPWAVRLPSIVFHTGATMLIGLVGARLYGPWTGILSAGVYFTLPGVFGGSLPLSAGGAVALFWAWVIWRYVSYLEVPNLARGLALGAVIGVGILASYAILLAVVPIALHMALHRPARIVLKQPTLYAGIIPILICLFPAVLYQARLDWPLLTGIGGWVNDWGAGIMDAGGLTAGVAFLGAQFVLLGPIIMAAFLTVLILLCCGRMAPRTEHQQPSALSGEGSAVRVGPDRMLFAFTLPVLLGALLAAMLHRVPNWGFALYVGAVPLTLAWLLRYSSGKRVVAAGVALNLLIGGLICAGFVVPSGAVAITGSDPYRAMSGWPQFAHQVYQRAQTYKTPTILTQSPSLAANLAYELRDMTVRGVPLAVRTWPPDESDAITRLPVRPYHPVVDPSPVLFVMHGGLGELENRFRTVNATPPLIRVDGSQNWVLFQVGVLKGPR